jgi:hypothetical protein
MTKIISQDNMTIFCKSIINFFPKVRIIDLFSELKLNCLRIETIKMIILSLVSGRKVDFNLIGNEHLTLWLKIRSVHLKIMTSKDKT